MFLGGTANPKGPAKWESRTPPCRQRAGVFPSSPCPREEGASEKESDQRETDAEPRQKRGPPRAKNGLLTFSGPACSRGQDCLWGPKGCLVVDGEPQTRGGDDEAEPCRAASAQDCLQRVVPASSVASEDRGNGRRVRELNGAVPEVGANLLEAQATGNAVFSPTCRTRRRLIIRLL